MGRQTSQYSFYISVAQLTFILYIMVNSSFYVVNFLLLIRSSFSFYMVKSTFYLVNFLLFI